MSGLRRRLVKQVHYPGSICEWVVENKDLFVSEKVVGKDLFVSEKVVGELSAFNVVGGRPRIYL